MAWNEAFERVRARLFRRSAMYRALFRSPGDELNHAAEYVLRDLANYCYASRPTLKVSQVTQQSDALAMAFAEGRRDVFNRITAMCNLSADQIERIAQHRTNEE
jgi:hypothetical protein